jgi:hypothetical protein
VAEAQRRSRVARLAVRRIQLARARRSPEEHSRALAASNADVIRRAALGLLSAADGDSLDPGVLLAAAQQQQQRFNVGSSRGSAISPLAPSLLCFDELQVCDVFSAVALKGLTEAAAEEGVTLCATGNRAPRELERHGLHEDIFDHFVDSLEAGMEAVEVGTPGKDYRRLGGGWRFASAAVSAAGVNDNHGSIQVVAGERVPKNVEEANGKDNIPSKAAAGGSMQQFPREVAQTYFWPDGPDADAAMLRAWEYLPRDNSFTPASSDEAPVDVPVLFGRTLRLARRRGSAAWFTFEELCGGMPPLGPADYAALAGAVRTVFLSGVPVMSLSSRDKARRFITVSWRLLLVFWTHSKEKGVVADVRED